MRRPSLFVRVMSCYDSAYQNRHGVDLRTVTPNNDVIVHLPEYGRTRATVLDANNGEDEFYIEVMNAYEQDRRTVSGDAFRPERQTARDPISDSTFNSLEEGDAIAAYLTGYEVTARVYVESIDEENNRVLVTGEFNALTIHRWVPQSLITDRRTEN